jgi:hypothetical protein
MIIGSSYEMMTSLLIPARLLIILYFWGIVKISPFVR